jgi:hypothetical protein
VLIAVEGEVQDAREYFEVVLPVLLLRWDAPTVRERVEDE